LHTEIFKWEKKLAADNRIGWLTIEVEEESGTSEVVYGCGHRKQKSLQVLE